MFKQGRSLGPEEKLGQERHKSVIKTVINHGVWTGHTGATGSTRLCSIVLDHSVSKRQKSGPAMK